jgi:hypothetical protein
MLNWAVVSGPEVSLLLAPAKQPEPVIAAGAGGGERTGTGSDPRKLAAARLRDLPVPMQSRLELARIDSGAGTGPDDELRRIRAGRGPAVDPPRLAGTVSRVLPPRRPVPGETVEGQETVPVPEWRKTGKEEAAGVQASDLAVRGEEPLLSRRVLAYRIPRWEGPGLPAVIRFRVAADGRVTSVIPLSAAGADRVSEASAAVLGWRFEAVPAVGESDGMWGTVQFE